MQPTKSRSSRIAVPFLSIVVVLMVGCAGPPKAYEPADVYIDPNASPTTPPGEPQIERGMSLGPVDTIISYTFGLPSKLLALNLKADSHEISPEVEASIEQYLEVNGLTDVKVRLNQYDPLGEWARLYRNEKMSWPIKYTLGVVAVLSDTLLPGRLLGGDKYNPFTDTVSIHSDLKGWAWQELAGAKDYAETKWKGLYAVAHLLPLAEGLQELKATLDAVRFGYHIRDREGLDEAYRVIFPAWGTYMGGYGRTILVHPSMPIGTVVTTMALLVPGHIVGRLQAAEPAWESYRENPEAGAEDEEASAAGGK